MTKINKELTNSAILNIMRWINKQELINGVPKKITIDNVISLLPIKCQWLFRKNLKMLSSLEKDCIEMLREIEAEYASDEKSHEVLVTDSDGNAIKDKDGKDVYNRIVNKEYIAEFNAKKSELLSQINDIPILTIDIEDIPDGIGFENLDMLSFMIEDDE